MSPYFSKIISYPTTATTNTEYLQNDCVQLRVLSKVIIILYCSPQQDTMHPGRIYPQYMHMATSHYTRFTLTEFSKRKQFNNIILYSSLFYTHQPGYNMCLDIDANGDGRGKNTHISVYLFLMAGKYDDQLEWLFEGNRLSF